jgi:hypothetical protein
MFVSSDSDKATTGHQDSIEIETRTTNRSRENVYEIYRFVLEELQDEAQAATYIKMILNNSHRDLLGQQHL